MSTNVQDFDPFSKVDSFVSVGFGMRKEPLPYSVSETGLIYIVRIMLIKTPKAHTPAMILKVSLKQLGPKQSTLVARMLAG